MLYSTTALRITALPISLKEFRVALLRTYETAISRNRTWTADPRRWGIAVSGGVDSMALAYLCKQMQENDENRPRFTAFVVDHRARTGSTEESLKVIEMLEQLGLETRRLCLEWPKSVMDPLKLGDFESKARRMRFRALGSACADAKIGNLLLGHHEDDLVETALFRLVRGGHLTAVQSVAGIPECEGLADVDNTLLDTMSIQSLHNNKAFLHDRQIPPIAKHGVLLHRPLLTFSKDRLTATCLSSGTSWQEDNTNKDLSLTPRNTIRHLLNSDQLPRALRKSSILSVADKQKSKLDDANRVALELLEHIRATLDTRSGVLTVRFPTRHVESRYGNIPHSRVTRMDIIGLLGSKAMEGFALLRYFARIVRPNSILGTDRILRIAKTISDSASSPKPRPEVQVFTSGGIKWTLHHTPNDWIWTLSRQPFVASQTQEICAWPRDDLGAWQLFDGRFWIKLAAPLLDPDGEEVVRVNSVEHHSENGLLPSRNEWNPKLSKTITHTEFQVCLLSQAGLNSFRGQMRDVSRQLLADFNNTLSTAAPESVRWTLPAITPTGTTDIVLALPTLGWQIPSLPEKVSWYVQYAHTLVPRSYLHEAVSR